MLQVQELFFSDPEIRRMNGQWCRSLPSFALISACLLCANRAADVAEQGTRQIVLS